MSTTVKWATGAAILAESTQTIAANATTAFDFGTPNDIDLANISGYDPGDRILVVLSVVRAAGTTSTLTFTIQDADDNAGSIGTPATAVTSGETPVYAAATAGAQNTLAAIRVQSGRPWIRINAVHGGGGTDSFQCHCTVLAVPSNA